MLVACHLRLFEDRKGIVYDNKVVKEIDLNNNRSRIIMEIYEASSIYHTSWNKIQNQFLFRYNDNVVIVTDNQYNELYNFNVGFMIRHIINETENTALILCAFNLYRYNLSNGSLSEIKLNLQSRTISSGIVVNEFLLLDIELEKEHQLEVYNMNDNKLISKESIDLKTL